MASSSVYLIVSQLPSLNTANQIPPVEAGCTRGELGHSGVIAAYPHLAHADIGTSITYPIATRFYHTPAIESSQWS